MKTLNWYKTFLTLMLITILSGCGSIQPDIMYNGDHPLSETAVFSAYDDTSSRPICWVTTIQKVDDKNTSLMAYPMWVRVRPGTHSFVVHCSKNFTLRSYQQAEILITVEDMKPRHVYVARYHNTRDGIGVRVDDLGENPSYGIPVDTKGTRIKPNF